MENKFTAEVLFICSPETVWSVLSDSRNYKEWYGSPEGYEIIDINPGFEKGGIITFRNRSHTAVITGFEKNRVLSIDSGSVTDTVYIIPKEELYCSVKMETVLHGEGEHELITDALLENMLEKLQRICYTDSGLITGRNDSDVIHEAEFLNIPAASESEDKRNTRTQLRKDIYTESMLSSSGKGLIAACILTLVLSIVISFAAGFPDSKYRISKESELNESISVGRLAAEKISIGQTKKQIEKMLDCTGLELSPGEYLYSSKDRTGQGSALENIVIAYNAFNQAAEYTYICNDRINTSLDLEYWDIKYDLNSDMNCAAVEQILGRNLTAFKVNRHGVKTLYFGSMDLYDSFSSKEFRSELVVRLDPIERYTEVSFYPSYSDRTGLPDSLEGNLVYQYRRDDVYIKDRDGFERIYTLLGRKRHEVDVVLGAGDYYQDGDETVGIYSVKFDDEHVCEYTVYFNNEGTAEKIEYINQYLTELQGTLKNQETLNISRGMTARELFEEIKMIPVISELSCETQVLYFGDCTGKSDGTRQASLTVTIDKTLNAVSEIIFLQE